jgi:hypothetical protein
MTFTPAPSPLGIFTEDLAPPFSCTSLVAERLMNEEPPNPDFWSAEEWQQLRDREFMFANLGSLCLENDDSSVFVKFGSSTAWWEEFNRIFPSELRQKILDVFLQTFRDFTPADDLKRLQSYPACVANQARMEALFRNYEQDLISMGCRSAAETVRFRLGFTFSSSYRLTITISEG